MSTEAAEVGWTGRAEPAGTGAVEPGSSDAAAAPTARRRLVVVHTGWGAAAAAPPGVEPAAFEQAALADTYEVLADLVGVTSAVAGPPAVAGLLWSGSLALPSLPLLGLADLVTADFDELVVVPADLPDLPGLVLAKVFKVLHRTDVVVAPERAGRGCVAIGVRLPLAPWLRGQRLDLDDDPYERLLVAAPHPARARCARAPDWHRMRGPDDLRRLDPGLEGWEETRALLAGAAGRGGGGGAVVSADEDGAVLVDPSGDRGDAGAGSGRAGAGPGGVSWDRGLTLADRFRQHAGDAQHLYGHAMRGMAEDWEAGGPVREICAGYEDAPSGAALQLRLLAGVFRLVLGGAAPELRFYYPCLGGEQPAEQAWPVVREVMAAHVAELQQSLAVAPQTNEVGRSAALLAGLFDVVAASGLRRVRLLEVGASAGLNLLLDRFCLSGPGWSWGERNARLELTGAIEGDVRPEEFVVVDRRGCDLAPVDPTTEQGRVLLTSFVWPFDLHRHGRLATALEVAQTDPVTVDRASASAWLPMQLGEDAADDVLTVVWQSITRLYWPAAEVLAVDEVLQQQGTRHPLARVSMEFDPDDGGPVERGNRWPALRTELWWPGTAPRRRRLGTAHDHGIPVRLVPRRGPEAVA